jgi:hypothetical protein
MARRRAQADLTEFGEQVATDWERAVILALQELAKDWPPSVMLVSMDGGLQVVRADTYRTGNDAGLSRVEHHDSCVLANIDGIPNDGGGW